MIDKPLASFLHLFVLLAFFSGAVAFLSMGLIPETRGAVWDYLCNDSGFLVVSGALFLASLLLLTGFYFLHRGKYLVIKMGASITDKALMTAIAECFSRNFDEKIILHDVAIGDELHISVTMKEAELEKAERELSILLKERFGYTKPFYLQVRAKHPGSFLVDTKPFDEKIG